MADQPTHALPDGVPYRPGPVGRIARLAAGLLVLLAAVGSVTSLVSGVSGAPGTDDIDLLIAVAIAAWVTPIAFDIGLGTGFAHRRLVVVAVAVAVVTAIGAAFGAPGTAFTGALLVWTAFTLGWLGASFLIAAVLRTPGCEMRALPHLASLALPGRRNFVPCPGPFQPLDEWEARTSGRAEPYVCT